ncbi:hypothetical protein GMST_32220 [Geomonas silvestris]|uniref:Uncharacterized protein n=1 Tax=Geomonas silvestris TaxID=2740184 RepID=A0A6V8MM16_9BACT|nr:hypothetical protein [Geomonas silvestris]GFO60897.1 hypothetical protein GMST_32220 [Geomonas silvestris]
MQTALQVAVVVLLAAAVNIPLGYLRQGCRKFSPGWWFYIHISIPLIIYARLKIGLGIQFIPFTLAGSVAGQFMGGRLYRKRNGVGE